MRTDRVQLTELSRLDWNDVDPTARPGFDPAGVAALVRVLPPAADIPPAGSDWRLTSFWFDRMTAALAERLGDWVVGWKYTFVMEEREGHGIVPVWRLNHPPVTTPEETLTRLADAVVAWHHRLVRIASDHDGPGVPPGWRTIRAPGPVRFYAGFDSPHLPYPGQLSWPDVDQTGRDFDPASVAAVVADLVGAAELPDREADWRLRDLWLETVTAGLIERYGLWVVGWSWSVGEGDLDGGPVGSWCCFAHSVGTPETTATAIAAALVEWHDWLVDVAERFSRFLPMPVGDLEAWERAVAHLVTAVGDRTRYESGWYGCCLTVLGWFLEAAGIDRVRHQELLDHAVGGRFESWTEPPRDVVEAVAVQVARGVVGA
ncbi:hypothetical protein [Actinoplanes xinjiangensis]|uniref:hypothetical protein n=1 Tax=Actinoplanes xinjiangensis TaxID=512350 RepID=UPI00343B2E9F